MSLINQQTNHPPAANIYQNFLGTTHTKYCVMDFFFRYNMSNIIRHKKKMELKLVWEHSGHFHCRVHSDSLAVFTLFCSPEQCVYAHQILGCVLKGNAFLVFCY